MYQVILLQIIFIWYAYQLPFMVLWFFFLFLLLGMVVFLYSLRLSPPCIALFQFSMCPFVLDYALLMKKGWTLEIWIWMDQGEYFFLSFVVWWSVRPHQPMPLHSPHYSFPSIFQYFFYYFWKMILILRTHKFTFPSLNLPLDGYDDCCRSFLLLWW
jgi:hypothetical protein